MYKLYQRSEISHCLAWLVIYLVLNTITGNMASRDADHYYISAVPNLLLAVICFIYLHKTKIRKEIGLAEKPTEKASIMLYYIPLFTLPLLSFSYGIKTDLTMIDVSLLLCMYAGVGFMEEIIFRGLMFQALSKKWNPVVVVVFISCTFAVGHITSMTAIGQSGADTVLQIINALVVGFMFMLVMIASRNITACIIAHILYNFIANLTNISSANTEIILISFIITALYFVYLLLRSGNMNAYLRSSGHSA